MIQRKISGVERLVFVSLSQPTMRERPERRRIAVGRRIEYGISFKKPIQRLRKSD
jgi:hypothetical protein